MTKNDKESKQSNETEIESISVDAETSSPASADANPEETVAEVSLESQKPADFEHESSAEDLLDDVRRSLIEEETDKDNRYKKWWRPFGKKGKSSEP